MIKTLIDDFIEQNNSIDDFIDTEIDRSKSADDLILLINNKLKETCFHADLGNDFADLLQLLNKKDLVKQFELNDISKLYDSLLKLQWANIHTFVKAGHFEFAVMDNSAKAREIVTAGLNMARQEITQLEILLDQINNE